MADDHGKSLRDLAPFAIEHGDLKLLLRPFAKEDAGRAQRAYERLSDESRLNRFWQMTRNLDPVVAAKLTDTDDSDHVGWLALAAGEPDDSSDPEFPGYGGVSYWRSKSDPQEAEFSITVLDDWQRKGFGSLLLSIIWFEGWHRGLRKLIGFVRPGNVAMCEWWTELGGTVVSSTNQHVLSMDLQSPGALVDRVSFDLHAKPLELEVAEWMKLWQSMVQS